jgi:hypothetical protein
MAAKISIQSVALLAFASQAFAAPMPGHDQNEAEEGHLFRRQCGVAGTTPARLYEYLVPDSRVRTTMLKGLSAQLTPYPQVHQNYQYKQLTDPLDCNDNTGCEIAATEVEGTTFSYSAGASVNGWISGGFEVGEYVESGQVANCQGGTGETICVWWRAGYTSYQVQTWRSCFAQGADMAVSDPFYMLSPNTNGLGSSYICAKGDQCRTKGFEFWNDSKSLHCCWYESTITDMMDRW